jgi:uncharacterized protein YcaQ
LKEHKMIQVAVNDFPYPLYSRSADIAILETTLTRNPPTPQAAIIAPLDNMLWGRNFIEALFGFRYRWEVYTPVAKREFGYYVLPILYGDRFVGRFEPAWDKKHKTLIVKKWWWEPDTQVHPTLRNALKACLRRFMRFLDAQSITVMPDAMQQADLGWLEEVES